MANAPVFLQRYFAQASLRILLSDRAADLTGPADGHRRRARSS